MIYGQWYGGLAGGDSGEILLSVDKIREDKCGSVGIMPTNGNSRFPVICRVTFNNVSQQMVDVALDGFIGFSSDGVVFPQNNERFQLSSNGSAQLNIEKLSDGEIRLVGNWATDLVKGEVTLRKVRAPQASPVSEVITWDQFKTKVSNPALYKHGTFFRGQPDSRHPLQTYFHRMKCWDLYRYNFEIIPELFDHLGVLNNTRYPTTVGADFGSPLLLAQHHGFPTPLLDWTLSPYIAAYFAFANVKVGNEPVSVRVFAFHADRWLLEQAHHTRGDILTPGITIRPLQIPLAGNKRAVAQSARSLFSSVENIENVLGFAQFAVSEVRGSMPDDYLDCFDIAFQEKDKVLHDLRLMNINQLSMFPEIETACSLLKKKYFTE